MSGPEQECIRFWKDILCVACQERIIFREKRARAMSRKSDEERILRPSGTHGVLHQTAGNKARTRASRYTFITALLLYFCDFADELWLSTV